MKALMWSGLVLWVFLWTPVAAGAQSPTATQENLFWLSIMDSTNSAEFEAYLEQFPTGAFRALAQVRLAALRASLGDRSAATGSRGPQTSGTRAGGAWTTFSDRAYYEPILAEPRAARIQLIVPSISDEFEFQEKGGFRLTWQITLGRELPIAVWKSSRSPTRPDSLLSENEWGFGIWAPVSFHMIEDFKDPSAPIINTDMRYGAMMKAQRGLSRGRALSFRIVPWAHESTHLGDEYSISAQRRRPDFERINVSYEYYEYGISYDTPTTTLRHGGIGILPWKEDGYYSNHPLEGEGDIEIPASRLNFEPSFGFEYRWPTEGTGRQVFVSADLRLKAIYNYQKASADVAEDQQWSLSLMIGKMVQRGSGGPATVPLRAIYFHLYHGVNPHGQFRSQRNYSFFGVGWTFDR